MNLIYLNVYMLVDFEPVDEDLQSKNKGKPVHQYNQNRSIDLIGEKN